MFPLSVPDNMSNLAVSTITKTLTKQIIIKLMKITQFRKNEDAIALSVMDLDILVNKIKTEIKSRPVSTFREHLRYTLSDERCMFADKPVTASGTCVDGHVFSRPATLEWASCPRRRPLPFNVCSHW